jgi:hypothetical protein
MRYKIKTSDSETFQCVMQYLEANAAGQVKLTIPERGLVSAEDLSATAIGELEDLGAQVSEEFQFSID